MSKKGKHHKPKGPKSPPQTSVPQDQPISEAQENVAQDITVIQPPKVEPAPTTQPKELEPTITQETSVEKTEDQTPIKPKRHRNRKKKHNEATDLSSSSQEEKTEGKNDSIDLKEVSSQKETQSTTISETPKKENKESGATEPASKKDGGKNSKKGNIKETSSVNTEIQQQSENTQNKKNEKKKDAQTQSKTNNKKDNKNNDSNTEGADIFKTEPTVKQECGSAMEANEKCDSKSTIQESKQKDVPKETKSDKNKRGKNRDSKEDVKKEAKHEQESVPKTEDSEFDKIKAKSVEKTTTSEESKEKDVDVMKCTKSDKNKKGKNKGSKEDVKKEEQPVQCSVPKTEDSEVCKIQPKSVEKSTAVEECKQKDDDVLKCTKSEKNKKGKGKDSNETTAVTLKIEEQTKPIDVAKIEDTESCKIQIKSDVQSSPNEEAKQKDADLPKEIKSERSKKNKKGKDSHSDTDDKKIETIPELKTDVKEAVVLDTEIKSVEKETKKEQEVLKCEKEIIPCVNIENKSNVDISVLGQQVDQIKESKDIETKVQNEKLCNLKKESKKDKIKYEKPPETTFETSTDDDILPSLATSIEKTLEKLIVCESDNLLLDTLESKNEDTKKSVVNIQVDKNVKRDPSPSIKELLLFDTKETKPDTKTDILALPLDVSKNQTSGKDETCFEEPMKIVHHKGKDKHKKQKKSEKTEDDKQVQVAALSDICDSKLISLSQVEPIKVEEKNKDTCDKKEIYSPLVESTKEEKKEQNLEGNASAIQQKDVKIETPSPITEDKKFKPIMDDEIKNISKTDSKESTLQSSEIKENIALLENIIINNPISKEITQTLFSSKGNEPSISEKVSDPNIMKNDLTQSTPIEMCDLHVISSKIAEKPTEQEIVIPASIPTCSEECKDAKCQSNQSKQCQKQKSKKQDKKKTDEVSLDFQTPLAVVQKDEPISLPKVEDIKTVIIPSEKTEEIKKDVSDKETLKNIDTSQKVSPKPVKRAKDKKNKQKSCEPEQIIKESECKLENLTLIDQSKEKPEIIEKVTPSPVVPCEQIKQELPEMKTDVASSPIQQDKTTVEQAAPENFEFLKIPEECLKPNLDTKKESGKQGGSKRRSKSPAANQSKNLHGPSSTPVKSSKCDYKKEKNKNVESCEKKDIQEQKTDIATDPPKVADKCISEKETEKKKSDKKHKCKRDTKQGTASPEQAGGLIENIEDLEEEFVYKYSFRTVFIANACHICKTQLKDDRVVCRFCHLVSYCTESHRDDDWANHQTICYAICTLSHVKGMEHIYGDAKALNGQDYRLLRMQAIVSCEKILKRKLCPWEQEVLLYPRLCQEPSCREWKSQNLKDCDNCGQVSFCTKSPGHLPQDHAEWCSSYHLYHRLVTHQLHQGRIEPEFPSKVYTDQYHLPETYEELFKDLYPGTAKDMDECHYATLTQLSTAPLTALYAYQKTASPVVMIDQAATSSQSMKEYICIHVIGAELQFEADTLSKWECFFLHLCSGLKDLRIVFVGPELNTSNLPVDLLSKIRLCASCRQNNRLVRFEFHDSMLYHDFVETEKFSKPDLICAFNPGFHRATGYAGLDTWPETISSALRLRVPLCVTAYTQYEMPRDLARVKTVYPEAVVKMEPSKNPFASLRPDRNFISDDEMPLIFKNYQIMVLNAN